MDKKKIISYLTSQKSKDYSYLIAFFITFSFFVFALIRPNLLEIFSSVEKIDQMKTVNSFYEKEINKSLALQSEMERVAPELFIVEQAVPKTPQINKMLFDIRTLIDENNLVIDKMHISDINLTDSSKRNALKSVRVNILLNGQFDGIKGFLDGANRQRRLKLLDRAYISREEDIANSASVSSALKLEVSIIGYYL